MRLTSKNTRNYIFSLPREKRQDNWISKNELIFYFRGQNETEYNRISILLPQRITFKKTTENKGEKHAWNQFKNKKSKNGFAARRNITVQKEKDESCTSKKRQKQGNNFEINRLSTV